MSANDDGRTDKPDDEHNDADNDAAASDDAATGFPLDPDEIAKLFAGELDSVSTPADVMRRWLDSRMVSAQWLDEQDFPPVEWMIPDLLPEGFGIVAAPPKAGKSWMVAEIGLACAASGHALGRLPVAQRPVLYLALEDGHRRLQERFRQIMQCAPLPGDMYVIVDIANVREAHDAIAAFLVRFGERKPLVIVDTFGRIKPSKAPGEDAFAADYRTGVALKRLVDAVPGSSLLVVHHTRKATSDDFMHDVSGTAGLPAAADFVLVLSRKRNEDNAVLNVTGRDVREGAYALRLIDGRWTLDGSDLADAAATLRERDTDVSGMSDRTTDVLRFVNSHSVVEPREVASALSMTANVASKYLDRLYKKNRIMRVKRGMYSPLPDPRFPDPDDDGDAAPSGG
ncbi:AAA family ATPase [Gordonia sp. CPCC 206044]|uniref:AAA family ATPase n=1 Tax=Gordonia sp. CPCC 206044 TaxID=3140793 RepID=UPI003AF3DD12